MDIEALENTTFAAIVEKIQKVRKRGELLESIHGILKKNFESVEIQHQIECQKIRNVIEGIPGELIGNTREMREVSKLVRQIAPTAATVLIRGKTGRVYGELMSLLTTMKGIPLAYNKDMQEDKEAAFDAMDTVKNCLVLFTDMLATIKFNKSAMEKSAMTGFTNATDAADYLVKNGVPFRDAHGIIGRLVLYAIDQNKSLDELSLAEYQEICPVFKEDIYEAISMKTCVEKRNTIGAPGPEAMNEVIRINEEFLSNK